MPDQRIRVLFRTAALFNWSAVVLFLPSFGLADRFGLTAPSGTPFEHVGIAAIGLFGLGYWMVAAAPEQNRGLVQVGLVGKVLMIGLILGHYLADDVNLRLVLVVSGDLVYSVLFVRYLAATRRGQRHTQVVGAG